MGSVRMLALAGAATLVGLAAANAADLGPPIITKAPPAPPIVDCCGGDGSGWYLRGDIGFSNASVGDLTPSIVVPNLQTTDKAFDAAAFFSAGIGYQFNSWIRADLTGEYRGAANFHGLQTWSGFGLNGTDAYSGSKSEFLFLANAFVDLGTWWCVTPFVGAGVGMADVRISNFLDQGTVTSAAFGTGPAAPGLGTTADTWNFAWALYAGLAYKVTPNVSIELAYRYLDVGKGATGLVSNGGGSTPYVMNFDHITSQDVMLGVRWMFEAAPPPPEPFVPLVRKG